jgi:hypothetical protein
MSLVVVWGRFLPRMACIGRQRCHSEEPFDRLRINSATKNLVSGKQLPCYAENETLRFAQSDKQAAICPLVTFVFRKCPVVKERSNR